MKKYFLFFIFIPNIIFSQSILQSNDTIKFWDSNDTLVFDDFKRKVLPKELDSNHVGLYSGGWHIDYNDDGYIPPIRTYILPYKSYITQI